MAFFRKGFEMDQRGLMGIVVLSAVPTQISPQNLFNLAFSVAGMVCFGWDRGGCASLFEIQSPSTHYPSICRLFALSFFSTKAAIPEMRKAGGGSIVNISSMSGMVGQGNIQPVYNASKGAIRIFTKSAAIQYAGENIRVNSVHPGAVDTPMTMDNWSNPEAKARTIEHIPLGRTAQPDDVAYGVLYLASDESSFVTGSELVIDGGRTAQ